MPRSVARDALAYVAVMLGTHGFDLVYEVVP